MESLVDDWLKALDGAALEQLTIFSLVPHGGQRSEFVGAAFKLPALRELRIDGWCSFDLNCGHLGALTSLVSGVAYNKLL